MMKKAKKPVKIDLRHFRFKLTTCKFFPEIWVKWAQLKKKEKLDEKDKFWLKEFRSQLKKTDYYLTVSHIKTRIAKRWVLNDLNFDKLDYAKALMDIIKEHRHNLQSKKKVSKSFSGAPYHLIDGVFEVPNEINRLAENASYNDPLQSKAPRHKNKTYIGIELEFNPHPTQEHTTGSIAEVLKKAKVGKYCHVGTDGSCGRTADEGGFEIRVLVTEDDYINPLTKIMKTLTDMGFGVNERCGTHVHLDMRNRDVKRVYNNFFYTQSFMRKLLEKSRKKNKYCKVNTYADFHQQHELRDRRTGINCESYSEHRSLEIRMHHGTLDPKELLPWIKLLIQIANYEGTLEKKVLTLKQAKEQYKLEESLQKDLQGRLKRLFSLSDVLPGA